MRSQKAGGNWSYPVSNPEADIFQCALGYYFCMRVNTKNRYFGANDKSSKFPGDLHELKDVRNYHQSIENSLDY